MDIKHVSRSSISSSSSSSASGGLGGSDSSAGGGGGGTPGGRWGGYCGNKFCVEAEKGDEALD